MAERLQTYLGPTREPDLLFLSDRDDDLGQKGSDFIANALFLVDPDDANVIRVTNSSDQMIVAYTWIFH